MAIAQDKASSRFTIQRVLFIGASLLVAYLVIPPVFFMVRSSFYVSQGFGPAIFSFQNYGDLFSAPETLTMLANSLRFALGSSLIALTLGTLVAWIVERTNTPFKNIAYLSAFTSFAIPGIIKVIGWILILGPEAGLLNVFLKELFSLTSSPFNIFTMTGMILVEGMVWTPVVFLFMAVPFRSMDPSLEEVAATSGAGIGKTFYHITFKLAMPSVLSVLLLTFIRALEAFEIPALIGIPGGIMVLTSEIYLKLKSGLLPKYGLASAYAVILVFFLIIGLYYYSRATSQAQKFSTITGKGFRPRLIDVGKWRYLTTALVFLLPTLVILPVLMLVWASFLPYYAPTLKALTAFTLDNYVSVIRNNLTLGAFRNSLFISLTSATATILLTAVMAWISVRTDFRGRGLLDQLASFTMILPGVVLGIALLVTYLTMPVPLYGTVWILVVAYVTRYIPYGMRYCYPGLLQINRELEESAQVSGASWWMVFRKIVIPLMMPSLFAGWIWVFLISIKELAVAILLSRPGSEVISVVIFNMWGNGLITEIGALSILLMVVLVGMAAVFQKFSRRYGLRTLD